MTALASMTLTAMVFVMKTKCWVAPLRRLATTTQLRQTTTALVPKTTSAVVRRKALLTALVTVTATFSTNVAFAVEKALPTGFAVTATSSTPVAFAVVMAHLVPALVSQSVPSFTSGSAALGHLC